MAMTIARGQSGSIERIDASWTSDASGDVTQSVHINGTILRVVTNPGATAPTDNYDLTALDKDGLDLFASQGLNRDTANSEHFCPGVAFTDGTTTSVMPVAYHGDATLTIANAGNAKDGAISIYVKR